MKAVILCGGQGTRIRQDLPNTPKPLVPIAGKPILYRILKHFARHGVREFVLCVGFQGNKILQYFLPQPLDPPPTEIEEGSLHSIQYSIGNDVCTLHFLETGEFTPTGGRILRTKDIIGQEPFFCTYADGLSNVDFKLLEIFHKNQAKLVSMTAVRPVLPFGLIRTAENGMVTTFQEKPVSDQWINGGFFIMEPGIYCLLQPDSDFEQQILPALVKMNELMAFKHTGYWRCLDTYKDFLEIQDDFAGKDPTK